VYSVYVTTNLVNTGFQPLSTNIPGPQGSYTNSTAVPVGFYKVNVRMAP
jgi:hypothetical protein